MLWMSGWVESLLEVSGCWLGNRYYEGIQKDWEYIALSIVRCGW